MVVVVLDTQFREFAWVESDVRRHANPFAPEHIRSIVGAGIAVRVFSSQPGDPARMKTPERLRIEAPVPESFGRQTGGWVSASLEALEQSFRLPGNERESGMSV